METTTDVASLIFLAKLVLGIGTLLGLGYLSVSIWSMLRQQPPAHDVYATKPELLAMETRLTNQITTVAEERSEATKDIHSKIDREMGAMRATLASGLNDMNRSIGRLEGFQDAKRQMIEAIKESRIGHD